MFRSTVRAGLLMAALLLLVVLATGCRLMAPASGTNQPITIKAQDTMRFDPASVTVPVGLWHRAISERAVGYLSIQRRARVDDP